MKPMWQNVNNSGISVEDIQMFVVLFFQPLCVYANLHSNKLWREGQPFSFKHGHILTLEPNWVQIKYCSTWT